MLLGVCPNEKENNHQSESLRIFSLVWINKENLTFAYGGKKELDYV